jgi:hypothetical protein
MKKITLLFVALFLGFAIQANAQCTPSHPGLTSVPDTGIMLPLPLPNATVNVAYEQTVTIGVPATAQGQTINWIKVNHVTSLLGNTWTPYNETGGTTFTTQWAAGTWQCVTLKGTPTVAGIDSIIVYIDAEVTIVGFPVPLTNQKGGTLPLVVQTGQNIGAEYIDNQVSVFPNPSNGNFSITVDNDYEMSVYDITGRIIESKSVLEGNSSIDLSNQNGGVYFIRLKNDNQTKVIRIVKR